MSTGYRILLILLAMFTSACGSAPKSADGDTQTAAAQTSAEAKVTVGSTAATSSEKEEDEVMIFSANGRSFTVTPADTAAARELEEKLRDEPLTVTLNEYGGFEKVGGLPFSLTREDVRTDTEPGDIMLYQGDQMTVFYSSNSWSYTKLGHIDASGKELEELFGDGDITVTLSLE